MRISDPDEHARQDHAERMNRDLPKYPAISSVFHSQDQWEEFVESTRSLAEYEQLHDEEFRMQAGRVDLMTETLLDDEAREEYEEYMRDAIGPFPY